MKVLVVICLLILLSAIPARACTSPCVNQGTSVANSSTISITPQATGDEIVFNVGACGAACATYCANTTSSPSYTWHNAVNTDIESLGVAICYAENVSASATTITLANATSRATPYDLVGVKTSTTLDVTAHNSGNGPNGTTGTTATSAQASEIAIGVIRGTSGTLSAIGGTVGTWTTSSGTGGSQVEGSDVGASQGTYGATMGAAAVFDAGVAVFLVASGATPTPTATTTATATATATSTATPTATCTPFPCGRGGARCLGQPGFGPNATFGNQPQGFGGVL